MDGLTKRYGPLTALDNLSFTVRPGHVTGFLGPNGAGKTTTMRIILGLAAPTSGRALVGGRRYDALIRPLLQVGSLLDATALHGGRTAWTHLASVARSNGIGRPRVTEVLRLTGLEAVANRRVKGFSLGMKQRLGIAAALLGDPPVLMFDEPVNGLDPEGVRWIRGFFRELASQGRTVLVSSHLMTEMALTADHLIIIGRGRLLADLPTAQLIESSGRGDVLVRSPRTAELAGLLAAQRRHHRPAGRRGPGRHRAGRRRHRRPGRRPRHRPARPGAPAGLAGGRLPGPHRGEHRLPRRDGSVPMTPVSPATPATATEPAATRTPGPSLAVRALDLLAAEWIKFRSVRSSFWSLLVAVVTPIGVSTVVAVAFASAPASAGSPPTRCCPRSSAWSTR